MKKETRSKRTDTKGWKEREKGEEEGKGEEEEEDTYTSFSFVCREKNLVLRLHRNCR
jgi:hypothetical protein